MDVERLSRGQGLHPNRMITRIHHGLLMKPYMVAALLRKRNPKRQTRRLIAAYNSTVLGQGVTAQSPRWKALRWRNKTYPPRVDRGPHILHNEASEYLHVAAMWDGELLRYRVRPRMSIGDLIYVKEVWAPDPISVTGALYRYCEGPNLTPRTPWKSPLFMPKRYARIWLLVTGMRAQRVQEISEVDAIAEGLHQDKRGHWTWGDYPGGSTNPVYAYELLFRIINGDKAWHGNPFVWIYDFKRAARPKEFAT